MKKSSDSIDRLNVKQLTLESKNGSVKLSIDNDGKVNFTPYNKNETGSFSIDLKNEKIFTKKIQFTQDNSSFTSSLNIGSAGSSISDGKFDASTGRLIEDFLPGDFNNIRQNAIDAIGKFDPSNGLLKDTKINPNILSDITKGVNADGKFDISGKLKDTHISDTTLSDIAKGVASYNDFENLDFSIDMSNPSLPAIKLSKGSRGFSTTNFSKTNIGLSNVENKNSFAIRNEITLDNNGAIQGIGTGAGTVVNNNNIGISQASDGTISIIRGEGLSNLTTNPLSTTAFTTVQTTANTANTTANVNEARFTGGLLNEANAATTLRNSTISIDANGALQGIGGGVGTTVNNSKITVNGSGVLTGIGTSNIKVDNTQITVDANGALQGIGTGIGTVVNNNSLGISQAPDGTITITRGTGLASLTTNPLSTSTFTTVQTTANNANTLSNSIEGRFSNGKLLENNIEAATVTKITNGNSAHSDLNSADISIDTTGKIQFNRGGSRGSSTGAAITKSHVGLPLVENKSAATITGEAFLDARFISVSSSARDGFASGSTARNFFDNSGTPQIKDANTPSGLKNSNISLNLVGSSLSLVGAGGIAATFTNSTVGLGNVENKNVSTIKNETFADTKFTTVSGNTNTVYNRFDNTSGRLLEANSLNKRPIVIQYGSPMPSNPQIGDLVTVIGDSKFIGTTYVYGVREYDLANIAGDSSFKSGFGSTPNKTTIWSAYLNPYFSKTSASTGQVKYQYGLVSFITPVYDYSLFVAPNSQLISIDRFYGETKFSVRYVPVTGSSYYTSYNYTATDQGAAGTSGDPAIYFNIETDPTAETFTSVSVYDATNDVGLGSAVSDFDGQYTSTSKGGTNYKYKTFYHIANYNNFYRYSIVHSNITDATTTRRILIEKITIEGWVPYDDTGVKSRLYELAQKTSQTFDTFTGQHKCTIKSEENIELYKTGFIVSSIGTYDNLNYENTDLQNKITPQEAVPIVKLSTTRKDKSVIGVICKEWEMSKYSNKNFKIDGILPEKSQIKRFEINSLGEGGIWICNINGNFQNGDYITSCEISGYGMKQDDDLLHNYTVAKITCDCDFDLNSPIYICEEFEFENKIYKKAFVGCTYHCG